MTVSVIITCYNYGRFLERAIRSVLDQDIDKSQYEIIVVNDNSSDETSAVMKEYSNRIKQIHNKNQSGISASRNAGIRKARGRYILNLDADDYLDNHILSVQCLFLNNNPEYGAVSCDYFTVDKFENHIDRIDGWENPIACGIMFRKDFLVRIGLYNEDIKIWEEKDLRKRFEKDFKIYNLKIPLYRYRKHGENHTSK